jgi:RNA recognition motif-containing protein
MNGCKLYVGNLPYEVTSTELMAIFESYGEIIEAMVIPDQFRQELSKGFGFVTFASKEDCTKALEVNGKEYKGRPLSVQLAKE